MVATRWVLVLTFFGVFASLAEVNAGRFCRRATACPCVQAASCVPVECVPVAVTTCLPTEHVEVVRTVPLAVTGPTITGKLSYGPIPTILKGNDIAITAMLQDGTLILQNPQYTTNTTIGTFSFNQ